MIEIEFPNREEAHLWMMRNQLGRRNLQPEALAYFQGMLYEKTKIKITNPAGRKGKQSWSENGGQNVHQQNLPEENENGGQNVHQQNWPEENENERKNVHQQNKVNLKTEEILAQEFKVNPRTIRRAAKYALAVDQIAELVGNDIRPLILSKTTGKKLTKKKILELAKTAKRKPEEVIEYFNPSTIKKSSPKEVKPFPFKVGEVVKIIPKSHPDLRGKAGCWAIVTEVHLTCCNLQLWNGTVEFISAEHLLSLELTPSECEQMKLLGDRLSLIQEKVKDPIVMVNLQFFGHLKHPKLTTVQEGILEYFENI